VEYGQGFILSGARSFDFVPGAIISYTWASLDATVGTLAQNTPVVTQAPTLSVSMPAPVAPGSYQFQLQVTDTSGNVSQPDIVTLIVVDNQAPTAVLSLADVNGVPLSGNQLPYGSGFILNGNRSFDVGGGSIAAYVWTSLDATVGTLVQNVPVQTNVPTLAVSMPTPAAPAFISCSCR
jgi:hypothetical protein